MEAKNIVTIAKNTKTTTLKQLLKFFIPLSTTPLIISMTHSIINAGLARLPMPVMTLAVFTVVKALVNTLKAPTHMISQATVSLSDGSTSFGAVSKFAWSLCAILLTILIVMGFTPVGGWVLRNVIGLTDPMEIEIAYRSMRIVWLLPVVEVLRNMHYGLAIGLKKTAVMPIGTTLRLLVISSFLAWAVVTDGVSGIVAGSLVWVGGIGIEALFITVWVFIRYRSPKRAASFLPSKNDRTLSMGQIIRFYIPLAVMMIVTASTQTIIKSGIAASSVSATEALAAYGVALGLIMIVVSPCQFLHQTAIVYANDWHKVKRFTFVIGLILSGIVLAMAFSPIGYLIMYHVIGAPDSVASLAVPVLMAFIPYPFLRAWREAYWGALMHNRTTSVISSAKIANVALIIIVIVVSFGPLRSVFHLNPAVIGVAAFVMGEALESLMIVRYAARNFGKKSAKKATEDR